MNLTSRHICHSQERSSKSTEQEYNGSRHLHATDGQDHATPVGMHEKRNRLRHGEDSNDAHTHTSENVSTSDMDTLVAEHGHNGSPHQDLRTHACEHEGRSRGHTGTHTVSTGARKSRHKGNFKKKHAGTHSGLVNDRDVSPAHVQHMAADRDKDASMSSGDCNNSSSDAGERSPASTGHESMSDNTPQNDSTRHAQHHSRSKFQSRTNRNQTRSPDSEGGSPSSRAEGGSPSSRAEGALRKSLARTRDDACHEVMCLLCARARVCVLVGVCSVCFYVCVCMYVYIYIYIYIYYKCVHAYVYICMYVYTCIYTYLHTCIRTHTHTRAKKDAYR
jgi:hypothetical protein